MINTLIESLSTILLPITWVLTTIEDYFILGYLEAKDLVVGTKNFLKNYFTYPHMESNTAFSRILDVD
jgi:hypothetical protein